MTINLKKPDIAELKPRITVFGVGGGGGNAVNNMINAGLMGVDFVVANTDAQALMMSRAERIIQLGAAVTEGLGAGSHPDVGRAAAEECLDEIVDYLSNTHMCFVTAGMGGGTGTGAAPVVARAAREKGILTVGVVTKPFQFEGKRRMKTAEAGIEELQRNVDTLIVIPNQNLFRIANEKTTFADAFAMADQVLYSGVACITDLMVKEGLINLDFADVRSVMQEMGKAMMGTGEASGEDRARKAAEAAISNPLLDETSMQGARGLLISITGGRDITLFEVDEAATRIREEVDPDANIILGATHDEGLDGVIRVSVVATGIDHSMSEIETASVNMTTGPKGVDPNYRPFQRNLDSVKKTVLQRVDASGDELLTMDRFDDLLTQDQNRNNYSASASLASDYSDNQNKKETLYEESVNRSTYHSPLNEMRSQMHDTISKNSGLTGRTSNFEDENLSSGGFKKASFNQETQNSSPILKPQARTLMQQLPEISEFPSIIQSTKSDFLEEENEQDFDNQNPRRLWQKITNSFKGTKQRSGNLARLEPADILEEHMIDLDQSTFDSSSQQGSLDQMHSHRQHIPEKFVKSQNNFTPRVEKKLNPDDDLEIPSFLRQQAH